MQTTHVSSRLFARASGVSLTLFWFIACGVKADEEAPYAAPYRSAGCGNGVREAREACDGTDLGGDTCGTLTLNALPRGQLRCSPDCGFDMSACESSGVGGTGGTSTSSTGGGPGTGGAS